MSGEGYYGGLAGGGMTAHERQEIQRDAEAAAHKRAPRAGFSFFATPAPTQKRATHINPNRKQRRKQIAMQGKRK